MQSDWHKEKSEALFTKMRNGECDVNGDEIKPEVEEEATPGGFEVQ